MKTSNKADKNIVNARRHIISVSFRFRHKFTAMQRLLGLNLVGCPEADTCEELHKAAFHSDNYLPNSHSSK